jgi:hypothetical protein
MTALTQWLADRQLLDFGVLALGLERGWATAAEVSDYATGMVGTGDERPEVIALAGANATDAEGVLDALRQLAHADALPTEQEEQALRRWMFARLSQIAHNNASPDAKLDLLEEAYAELGYPEEMRECSRYYVPPADRERGLKVGDHTTSPLEALDAVLERLSAEFT